MVWEWRPQLGFGELFPNRVDLEGGAWYKLRLWLPPRLMSEPRNTAPDQPCLAPGDASIRSLASIAFLTELTAVTASAGLFQAAGGIDPGAAHPARRCFRNFSIAYGPQPCASADPCLALAPDQGGFECLRQPHGMPSA